MIATREAPPRVGRAGMNRAEVHRLIRDLKRFREAFTWTVNGNDKDVARRDVDGVLHAARTVLALHGLYSCPEKVLDGEEVPS